MSQQIPHAPVPPVRLLDQVRECLRVRHYAIRTETAYVDWIRRFILFHGKRHPKDMGAPEVGQYLMQFAAARKVFAAMQIQMRIV